MLEFLAYLILVMFHHSQIQLNHNLKDLIEFYRSKYAYYELRAGKVDGVRRIGVEALVLAKYVLKILLLIL